MWTPRAETAAPAAPRPRGGPPVDAADLPPLDGGAAPPPRQADGDDAFSPTRPLPRGPREASADPMAVPLPAMGGGSGSTAAPARSPGAEGRDCRPYTSTTSLMGQERRVSGLACRLPDGRWKLVSENAE
jgi:hypothetical protein